MREELVHGSGTVTCELPDDTVFPSAGLTVPLEVAPDLTEAYRQALTEPLDTPPLRAMARSGSRVTIAFDDATVGQYAPVWSTAIPLIVAELEAGGVEREHISLLCANALHRKFTTEELATLLGADVVEEFSGRLSCHDAEDLHGIVSLGTTENGYHVDLNRAVTDDDLTVYLNCSTVRGFSGGWKSICVGLSTYRSIAAHHNPDDMSMSIDRNRMHEMLNEMGSVVVDRLGRERIFKLETVQASPIQVSRVFGGTVDGTRRAALDLIRAHQAPRRDLVAEKVDVVLYGVPDWSPYAAFSHTNPLLTLVSTALGYLGGVIEAFGKPGCTVILSTPCPDRWDDVHHPSYREVWTRVLAETRDPYEARARYEEEFATREDYRDAYRSAFGFHGVHGIMATFPLKRLKHAARVCVAGAEDPALVRHVGFEPYDTIEDALASCDAGSSVACVRYPQAFNRTL